MNLCTVFAILAVIVVVAGYLLMFAGVALAFIWLIGLGIALLTTGGPGAAVYAGSWPVLIVAFGIMLVGFVIASIGYLLLWLGSLVCTPRVGAGAAALGSTQSNLFSFAIPGLNLGALPGGELGLLGVLMLPNDQLQKLPPGILEFINCLRGCLCRVLCKSGAPGSSGSEEKPGQVIVDAGKTLLEDLKAQLETARHELERARQALDVEAAAYWGAKITELTRRIAGLGG